ncbi:unnamed protein product [Didymodactylos carnosus]|uniref:Uncharacterized protein n=1 Tax=Didymodactylos carnosus TaxID=1234261 RepID=A0A816HP55_9BILA|nr:unnamed protein product [Didymodactylos carnosus]CAF4045118.1 unnamed protein product [Didymodactylos carnosus]
MGCGQSHPLAELSDCLIAMVNVPSPSRASSTPTRGRIPNVGARLAREGALTVPTPTNCPHHNSATPSFPSTRL